MKTSTQRYPPIPDTKRVNFWVGHYGVDLSLNRLEMASKAGVPILQVLVLPQIEDVIDGL